MAVEIKIPSVGESVAEGEIAEWLKAEGDAVEQDEPLVVIETDKITIDLPAPASGTLSRITKKAGSVVQVGDVIGYIEEAGEAPKKDRKEKAEPEKAAAKAAEKPAAKKAEEKPAPKREPEPDEAEGGEEPALSPAVRRLVEESGVDPARVEGSGKGGRILKSDVEEYIESRGETAETEKPAPKATPADDRESVAHPAPPRAAAPARKAETAAGRSEERVRMTRIRQRIAERLLESQSTTASLTTFNDVDLSAVMELRKQYKEPFQKKYGISLGFMSFFIKASIEALKAFPSVNATIDGEEIVYRGYYDIGVAVSSDRGLVVPIIRDAQFLSFAETEQAVSDLAKRARDGKLTIEELTGGTFSISNGGVFGSLLSTPILNPPQSGILGMHRIEKRPIVVEDQIVIRPMMYLALTYDHRLIDGREAVSFLVRMKECLEDPRRILIEV